MFTCDHIHVLTYCSGKMGNDDPQTHEIARNKNRAVQRAVQNCHDLCPTFAHKENSGNFGNNSVTQSGVVQLPGLSLLSKSWKVDPELSDGTAPAGAGTG